MNQKRRRWFDKEFRADIRESRSFFIAYIPTFFAAAVLSLSMSVGIVPPYLSLVWLLTLLVAGTPAAVTAAAFTRNAVLPLVATTRSSSSEEVETATAP